MRSLVETLDLEEYRFEPCGQAVEDPRTEAEASLPVRIAAWAQDKADILGGNAGVEVVGHKWGHNQMRSKPHYRVERSKRLISNQLICISFFRI